MRVRDARAADAAALSGMASAAFVEAYGGTSPEHDLLRHVDAHFSEAAILAAMQEPEVAYLLAEDDDGIGGLAKLRDSDLPELVPAAPALEVQQIYVATEYQRRGIGGLLMDAAVEEARRRGVIGIWLSVWRRADWAVSFYRKFGFEPLGEVPFMLADTRYTDYLMWLPLDRRP